MKFNLEVLKTPSMRFLFFIVLVSIFSSCSSVKYFIVRHAEKEVITPGGNMNASDPSLSPAGKVRAIELREELKDDNIRYIYSTNLIRTISTAQPLNELRGATQIELYDPRQPDSLINKLKSIRKGNVLIVGHSNTVDDIVNKLVGTVHVPGDLKDSEYDNLYIVTRRGKNYTFMHRTYGTLTE